MEIVLGGMTFLVEGRYAMGLSNLIKDPSGDEKATTQNIYILIGYGF